MSAVGRGKAHERGLSVTELMITLAMFGVLLASVLAFVTRTRGSLVKQEGRGILLERAERIQSNLRASIGTSRMLMATYQGGSPDFGDFRDFVLAGVSSSAGTPPPAPFCAAPIVTNTAAADLSSTGQTWWGNDLLFLSALKPVTFTVHYGSLLTSVAQVVSVDRVQFVYIYPALVKVGAARIDNGIRLAEWRSEPFVLYGSISSMSNAASAPRLSETCKALAARGYFWALDLDNLSDFANAWVKIAAPGGGSLLTPVPAGPAACRRSHWAFMDEFRQLSSYRSEPGIDFGQVQAGGATMAQAGPAQFLLAFNVANPAVIPSPAPLYEVNELRGPGAGYRVPAYALAHKGGTLPGFPGGFEIAIQGHPQAREVATRVVLMATGASNQGAKSRTFDAYESLGFLSVKNDY